VEQPHAREAPRSRILPDRVSLVLTISAVLGLARPVEGGIGALEDRAERLRVRSAGHAHNDHDRTIYPGAYPQGTAIRFASFQLWAGPL
jgi:hypothetical protein